RGHHLYCLWRAMGNKNRSTKKAKAVEVVESVKPVIKVEPKNPVAKTTLSDDEKLKVSAFIGLDGTVVNTGTVEAYISYAMCDSTPEKIKGGGGFSVRIGGKHRIQYNLRIQNGHVSGEAKQFFLVITSVGDPTYSH